jgi:hypothetical protein
MKLKNLIEELENTQEYKEFKNQNPNSFFSIAFIILDLENKTEQIQLDYFLEKEKIVSFEYPFNKPKMHEDIVPGGNKETTPQSSNIRIDIENLEEISKNIIEEKGVLITLTKIIAILKENKWSLTCMDNTLGIIKIKIDAMTGEVQEFKKDSLMNFIDIKKNN